MPDHRYYLYTLLIVCCCTILPGQVHGQKNLVPATHSGLTGIALPQGTKLDKRLLMRVAAKTTMDIEAKDAGRTLGDNYEVFLLPASTGHDMSDTLISNLESLGWKLTVNDKDNKWGWLEKSDKEYMIFFEGAKNESWLYLAEVAGKANPASTPPLPAPAASVNPPINPGTGNGVSLPSPASPGHYQFTTSHFEDGWTATVQPDYVLVTNGTMTCYLFYRITMTDEMRPPATDVRNYFWNKDVKSRFNVLTEDHRRQELMFAPTEYIEGEVTDKQTGKKAFAGMNVSRNNGGALNIVVVAPDKSSFYQAFPKPDDLERMITYNKFAVAAVDLIGHWTESSGAYAQMYYVNTGNYAGMNAVSTSAEFWLEANGSYLSQHKGASGLVGNQQFFQQEYRGKYTMNGNWELNMTNRYNGKTDIYLCHFEVVKGGRILHLTDKSAPGVQYHLGKLK